MIGERFIPAVLKDSYTSLARDLLHAVDSIIDAWDVSTPSDGGQSIST